MTLPARFSRARHPKQQVPTRGLPRPGAKAVRVRSTARERDVPWGAVQSWRCWDRNLRSWRGLFVRWNAELNKHTTLHKGG